MHFRTRAIHVGQQPDPQTGAVVPPGHLSSTFVQPGAGVWGEFDYTRSGSPTRKALETTLADLLERVKELELASDEPWESRQALQVHGPSRLPIRFKPCRRAAAPA